MWSCKTDDVDVSGSPRLPVPKDVGPTARVGSRLSCRVLEFGTGISDQHTQRGLVELLCVYVNFSLLPNRTPKGNPFTTCLNAARPRLRGEARGPRRGGRFVAGSARIPRVRTVYPAMVGGDIQQHVE
jgi:hypothetical protein